MCYRHICCLFSKIDWYPYGEEGNESIYCAVASFELFKHSVSGVDVFIFVVLPGAYRLMITTCLTYQWNAFTTFQIIVTHTHTHTAKHTWFIRSEKRRAVYSSSVYLYRGIWCNNNSNYLLGEFVILASKLFLVVQINTLKNKPKMNGITLHLNRYFQQTLCKMLIYRKFGIKCILEICRIIPF